MPRDIATTRDTASRRFTPRDQVNHIYTPITPGHVNFGDIELSGEGGKYLSILQWVKFGPAAPSNRATFSKFNFGTGQRSWGITSPNGQFKFLLSPDGGALSMKQYQTYGSYNDGRWHAVGFVWNNGTLKICVDDSYDLVVNKIVDPAFSTIHQGTANVALGALTSGAAFPNGWEGGLSVAVAVPRAITEDEWLGFYYEGKTPAEPSLECLMKTPGGNVIDASGNGYDGVLAGNAVWADKGPFGERELASARDLAV